MKLIDKSALVAEIKKRIKETESMQSMVDPFWEGQLSGFDRVLKILDTLEVKEIKEPSVSKELEEAIGQSFIYHENHGDDFRSDKQIETAYRYGFETGVKYKEKQNLEIKVVDLEKEIKNYLDKQPIITRSKGIDYKLVPSPEVIAKHFYELGLKTQKEE